MTRPSTPPILSELRSASSPTNQVAALRALKNEIIGHDQKKEIWISLGVLAPIARILSTQRGNGKRKHRDVHPSRAQSKQRGVRNDQEDARLQAVIIVGSLARGGPAYVPPIYAALIIPPLLFLLSLRESSPSCNLAALRSLNAIADSLLLCNPKHVQSSEGLLPLLYSDRHIATLKQLLLQASHTQTVQHHIALTATLISKTCHEEHQRAILARAGILEALALCVAAFVVGTGCAMSPSIDSGSGIGHPSHIPPAPSSAKLSPILQAVSAIIQHSRSRATQFLCAPAFASVFQRPGAETDTFESKRGTSGSKKSYPSQMSPTTVDHLLPLLPNSHQLRNSLPTSSFPSLSALNPSSRQDQPFKSFSSAIEIVQTQGLIHTEDDESPLINWLLYIVRTENEVTGLNAAMVLAILYRQGMTKRGKEAVFALLLVPILSRMLDKDSKISSETGYTYDTGVFTYPERFVKEQAPSVLAMLAAKSFEVQRAAAEAGIIKKLSQLLKESYDELPMSSPASLWAPGGSVNETCENQDEASKLGPIGLSPLTCHIIWLREFVLNALAAIASDKDDYRKVVIENGVVPFVVKALKPAAVDSGSIAQKRNQTSTASSTTSAENSKDTILAACGAARALSRSVCTLRTSLMDAGLPPPLFALLKHQDIDLQIASTGVICNLVLRFSPLQEAIIEAGVLKTLCEHAHSVNPSLCLNSVWALKHLIYEAPNDVKMTCLTELGPAWLNQIVTNDVEVTNTLLTTRGDREDGSTTPMRMSTPNAAGEQVDLLNAVDEHSRASSQDVEEDGEDDVKMADSIGALSRPDYEGKRHTALSQNNVRDARPDTADLTRRNLDQGISYQGMSDELAIQKEGLDLLRNLITGAGVSDMIDFVFRELGQDKLFEMLTTKLRPRLYNVFNRERRSSENGVRHVQPQNEIVLSICYLIVHLAAGDSRQRQILVAQTELLKLIIPLFNHADCEIRRCCVWLCINMIWRDTASDEQSCKTRARELAKLGMYEKLEQMMESDPDLDIRERAKTASHQMGNLLRH